jgi:hypothetical protein
MKVRDLIDELAMYPADARVCVEVGAETGKHFDHHTNAVYFTVAEVEPENDDRHGVKITLAL